MRKIAVNINNIFVYALMLLVVISCRSLLLNIISERVVGAIFLLIAGLYLLYRARIRIKSAYKNKWILFIYMYSLMSLILLIFGNFKDLSFVGIQVISVLLFSALLMGNTPEIRNRYLTAFSNIVYIISLCSLFFFLFGTTLGIIQPTNIYSADLINWGGLTYKDYFHLYNEAQETTIFGTEFIRNIGIFLEAPMYAYVLLISLYFELFLRKNNLNKKKYERRIILLLITIATTLSTTGIVMACSLLYIKGYQVFGKKKIIKYGIWPFVLIIVTYIIFVFVYDKVATGNISGMTRIDDLKASFLSFLESPIIGNGYRNSRAMDPFRASFRNLNWTNDVAGLSTGVGGVLSNGGIVWSVFWFTPLIVAVKYFLTISRGKNQYGFIVLLFVLLFVTVIYIALIGPIMNTIAWSIIFCPDKEDSCDEQKTVSC